MRVTNERWLMHLRLPTLRSVKERAVAVGRHPARSARQADNGGTSSFSVDTISALQHDDRFSVRSQE